MIDKEPNTNELQAAETECAETKPQLPKPQPGDAAYPDKIIEIDPEIKGQRHRIIR